MPRNAVDILENDFAPEVLEQLLRDHTTRKNIFWATHDYEERGEGYQYADEILPKQITGENGKVIMPRVKKSKEQQTDRSKGMAEVFTPSWICNAQNNLVDEAWFGRKDVFNVEVPDRQTWETQTEKIEFPANKTWRDYVRAVRMEMACGEAPYLVSRYDTTTGEIIPLPYRIGMLDRKLRVISENTETTKDWLYWAKIAFRTIYGFEWQGDNLLLAREALLLTFIDYYKAKFGRRPRPESVNYIAYVISWNLWQMDGLRGVVPNSCQDGIMKKELSLFGERDVLIRCPGCKQENIQLHNGTYCLIRDWQADGYQDKKNKTLIRFIDLINT